MWPRPSTTQSRPKSTSTGGGSSSAQWSLGLDCRTVADPALSEHGRAHDRRSARADRRFWNADRDEPERGAGRREDGLLRDQLARRRRPATFYRDKWATPVRPADPCAAAGPRTLPFTEKSELQAALAARRRRSGRTRPRRRTARPDAGDRRHDWHATADGDDPRGRRRRTTRSGPARPGPRASGPATSSSSA